MAQFTEAEKYQELLREVRMRMNLYDKLITRSQMRRETAKRQLEIMQAIAADYAHANPQLSLFPTKPQRAP